MKILVIQLARFGDIYQSWPSLRAIKRKYPGAEIHVLVRKRFVAALEGIGVDVQVHQLDTASLLETFFKTHQTKTQIDIAKALNRMAQFINEFHLLEFDRIVNLSFSPFSSYLVKAISCKKTQVRGYTRHSDGYLSIPDNPSAYFYAQVGVGRMSRIHLTEIFASVAEVELCDQDWLLLESQQHADHKDQIFEAFGIPLNKEYVVLHAGASDRRKTLKEDDWGKVCNKLLKWWTGQIVLVGGPDEATSAQRILEVAQSERVYSLVGKTRLPELFPLLSSAAIVVGGDSVVLQMASLAQAECFNLSFSSVRFWETGPREPGSRVLVLSTPESANTDFIAKELWHMAEGLAPANQVALAAGDSPVWYQYESLNEKDDFSWDLIKALYLGDEFPAVISELQRHGFQRIYKFSELAIAQIEVIKTNRREAGAVAAKTLGQLESLLGGLRRMVPELDPLISWFETEKLRIGPGSVQQLADHTRKVFESLRLVAGLYTEHEVAICKELEEGDADNNLVS